MVTGVVINILNFIDAKWQYYKMVIKNYLLMTFTVVVFPSAYRRF